MIPSEPIGSIPRPTELFEASREVAFAKIRARVEGTALAAGALGLTRAH